MQNSIILNFHENNEFQKDVFELEEKYLPQQENLCSIKNCSKIIMGENKVRLLFRDDYFQRALEIKDYDHSYTLANYLHDILPNAKFIVILRNPVDR